MAQFVSVIVQLEVHAVVDFVILERDVVLVDGVPLAQVSDGGRERERQSNKRMGAEKNASATRNNNNNNNKNN